MDQGSRDSGAGSRSIRLFLLDGTPRGLTMGEIGNWSGKAFSAPRGRLDELLRRSEPSRTGIYILMGPDPDCVDGEMAYVGEADDVAARLRYHIQSDEKDLFERVMVVVSADDSLTKSPVRYLESQLLKLTQQAGSVALANTRRPDFRRLPEVDRADMDSFLAQLRLILPILGFDLLRPSTGQAAPTTPSPSDIIFAFATAGASATARETEDGFVVLSGSTARRAGTETFPVGRRTLRDQLVADGRLVDGPTPETYRFTSDVVFGSPSAAASIVAARSASGPLEWKVVTTGQTYRDWRAAKLA